MPSPCVFDCQMMGWSVNIHRKHFRVLGLQSDDWFLRDNTVSCDCQSAQTLQLRRIAIFVASL